MLIYLKCTPECEVSYEDFDFLNGYTFTISEWGYLRCRTSPYRNESLHIMVAKRMGLDTSKFIDHHDRNKLNNQRFNLRIATHSQNMMNSSVMSFSKTGVKGVRVNSNGRFESQIKLNGKYIYLGVFDVFEDALQARVNAEKKYFGNYASRGE